MKNAVLISVLVFLSACSSSPKNNQVSNNMHDKIFRLSMYMACFTKYANEQRCTCNTQVLFDAAGQEFRAKFAANPEQHQVELFMLMIEHDSKLDECKMMASSEKTESKP